MVEEQGPHRREAAQVVFAGDELPCQATTSRGSGRSRSRKAPPLDEELAGLLLPLVGGEGARKSLD